jgi:outer membrane protein assembly factor BamD
MGNTTPNMDRTPFLRRRVAAAPPGATPSRSSLRALLAGLCVALALAGCGLFPEVKEETAGWSADRLYKTAHDTMLEGNYIRATKLFETLEARFPYGRYAQQAILESAYANWRGGEQAAAIAAADRFIRTYPNHPNVDYAYYLKGLVHFREDQGLIGYVYELDLSERDPKEMRASFAAFKELTTRFPDSQYYQDSIARMRYLNNAMATYETNVAMYYFRRGAYVAAANRAQGALLNFPQTPANARALDIMRRSYEKLGLVQLAEDSEKILVKTFPDSRYVTGDTGRPWWNFWSKEEGEFGVTPTGAMAVKPWWQFW